MQLEVYTKEPIIHLWQPQVARISYRTMLIKDNSTKTTKGHGYAWHLQVRRPW